MACSLLRATAYLPGHKCCLSRFSGTLRPRLHRESNRYQYLALTPLHWFWFSQSTRNRRVLSYNVNGILLHKAEILQQVRNATKSLPVFYPGCMLTYHKLFVSSRLHTCIKKAHVLECHEGSFILKRTMISNEMPLNAVWGMSEVIYSAWKYRNE